MGLDDDKRESRACLSPPKEGTIHKGKVSRIESYGAFVQLFYPYRGLVHISQLANIQLKNIEDAVSVGDVLYVKVLECEEVTIEKEDSDHREHENGYRGRKRHKIRLSAKYASQDGLYTDLDPDGNQADRDSNAGARVDRHYGRISSSNRSGVPSDLEKSLNSKIGMGIALDPAATMDQAGYSNSSRIVLRGQHQQAQKNSSGGDIVINGYALVDIDDHVDEGNKKDVQKSRPPDPSSMDAQHSSSNLSTSVPPNPLAIAPMGRGRGATLPAWMTSARPQSNKNENNVNPSMINHAHNYDNKSFQTDTKSSRDHDLSVISDDTRKRKRHGRSRKRCSATDTFTRDQKDTKKRRKRKEHKQKSRRHHKSHRRRRTYSNSTYDSHDDSDSKDFGDGHKKYKLRNDRSIRSDSRYKRRQHRSLSNSDTSSDERSRHERGRYHRKRVKRKRQKRRHTSKPYSDCSSDTSIASPKFENIEEAMELIKSLEKKDGS